MVFSTPRHDGSRLPELVAALSLGAALAAVAFREGHRQGQSREMWTSSSVRMRLPDGSWIDAGNLADAGCIMKTINALAALPETVRPRGAGADPERD